MKETTRGVIKNLKLQVEISSKIRVGLAFLLLKECNGGSVSAKKKSAVFLWKLCR